MGTNPERIAAAINHIATKIDNSSSPSVSAVKRDIRTIIAAVNDDQEQSRRVASDIVRLAMRRVMVAENMGLEDQKLRDLLWDDAGKEVQTSYETSRVQTDDSKLKGALKALKRDVDDFIKEIEGNPTELGKMREETKKEEKEGDVVTSAPPLK